MSTKRFQGFQGSSLKASFFSTQAPHVCRSVHRSRCCIFSYKKFPIKKDWYEAVCDICWEKCVLKAALCRSYTLPCAGLTRYALCRLTYLRTTFPFFFHVEKQPPSFFPCEKVRSPFSEGLKEKKFIEKLPWVPCSSPKKCLRRFKIFFQKKVRKLL